MTTTLVEPAVRAAAPADHDAVRHIVRAAYRQYAAALPALVYLDLIEDLLNLHPGSTESIVLVADLDGTPAGAATLSMGRRVAGIRAVAVAPALRGAGIGRRLVQACAEHAWAAGARIVYGRIPSFVPTGARLAAELGFRRAPGLDHLPVVPSRLLGGPLVPALAYRLDLAGPPPAGLS